MHQLPHPVSAVENTLGGCLVQLLSLPAGFLVSVLCWFAFADAPNGWIMAAISGAGAAFGALVLARQYSTVYRCGTCRNNLTSPAVRMCPTCRASW
jgi:hypothetical protein